MEVPFGKKLAIHVSYLNIQQDRDIKIYRHEKKFYTTHNEVTEGPLGIYMMLTSKDIEETFR